MQRLAFSSNAVRGPTRRRLVMAIGAAASLAGCATQPPPPPARVRVNAFLGAQDLALFAGVQRGFFARRGLQVELQFTGSSVEQRKGLAAGAFEIANTAVDNAVAMREAGQDAVILSGGDNSLNELFVQPQVASIAQLRGRTLLVDAPHTAYALQAKKILKDAGLRPGDYEVKAVGATPRRLQAMLADRANAASMLYPPFSFQARAGGLRSLGSVADLIGPYQASGAVAMRPWAYANSAVLERYLMAWIEATRWALDRRNHEPATALLAQYLKLPHPLAQVTYDAVTNPVTGVTPEGAFDRAGFANVLALRAEIEGQWGGRPPPQERYVDLQWYSRAQGRLALA